METNFMRKNVWLYLMTILLCVGFGSCSKDDDTNSSASNVIVGKWNFQDTDNQGVYNGSWTFNNDGTMLINDRNDFLDGQSIAYNYNSDTKKLTAFGIVLQLVWVSSTKFTIKDSDGTTIEYIKQ